jgi:uncharacterized protein (TIGR02596 family)
MQLSSQLRFLQADPRSFCRRGFSLIELLAVIAIIGIMMAAAAPGMFAVIRATKLTSAGDTILSRVAQAQQLAQTMSSPVELRFYSYTPGDQPGAEEAIRAVQLVDPESESVEGGVTKVKSKALSEPFVLPAGMVVATSSTLSPLTQSKIGTAGDFFASAPEAKYSALHFYPDGSFKKLTALPADTTGGTGAVSPALVDSFLTIVADRDVDEASPKNFFCIQLDPYTSKARLYRP